jgi:hypothetical protein
VHYANCRPALVFFRYFIDILFSVKYALTTYLFYCFESPEILLHVTLASNNKVEDLCEFILRNYASRVASLDSWPAILVSETQKTNLPAYSQFTFQHMHSVIHHLRQTQCVNSCMFRHRDAIIWEPL